MKSARCDAFELNSLLKDHLQVSSVGCEDAPWTIKKSPLGGYGIFTKRAFKPNEIIYKDAPMIIGPRAALLNGSLVCVGCHSNANSLFACKRGCGLPVCSSKCENSPQHVKECRSIKAWQNGTNFTDVNVKLYKSLTPIRSILLDEKQKRLVLNLKSHRGSRHGFEIDVLIKELNFNVSPEDEAFMRHVCTVLDANAFEVVIGDDVHQNSLRGLYPLGSLSNHQCVPNTMHVFDEKQAMIVKAAVDIPANVEIFHSYSRLIWGTTARRYHLKQTKHFWCCCPRCSDPTEYGSNMSAICCEECGNKGLVLPINPLDMKTQWRCDSCNATMENAKAGMIASVLSARVISFHDDDVDDTIAFLDGKLKTLVPETNQTAVELKYRIVWILGYKENYTWSELSKNHLISKEKICRDLLYLLEKLGTGLCKLRGLLSYELYKTLKELRSRSIILEGKEYHDEISNLLLESAIILKEDASKPAELNEISTEINNNLL